MIGCTISNKSLLHETIFARKIKDGPGFGIEWQVYVHPKNEAGNEYLRQFLNMAKVTSVFCD